MATGFFKKTIKLFFVVANILVAICFCLGCYANIFFSESFWLVGFFTLASFYLLLVLFIFFVGWLFARSRWAFLFIGILLITYKPILNIIPLQLPTSFTLQKPAAALRIMSWNVESFQILNYKTQPQLRQQMIELIKRYDPDVACFQEMTTADSDKTAMYQLKDFVKDLGFPYYFYAYNILDDYYPGTHTHYGRIIFSKKPIINKQMIEPDPLDYNRTFQYIDIVNNTDTFRVFNCHLQTMRFTQDNYKYIDSISSPDIKRSEGIISKLKASFPKRKIQADRIKEEMKKSPYPVILCGDFNDVPNSYAYTTIGDGLQNAFEKKGYGIGRTFSDILPTLRIDNIFLDNNFEVAQYTRVKKMLSDHYPIIADVIYKSR
ncbi:endonuclease/exonuclease/phosphatase family protein [Ferruginibacter albus]|uniref:endonuclease/exonuclease/phosphatase family protein n=1 Tax=Ferruginibacter albus TaxID=2875540 RepID=UPI001CC33C34|nr:endonuclease/exonuclease/phosphatase family protein [Ferruginibacter albus]UAY51992.1 endonuclease/exonuclease/phosphatase family protein [Ferruginibacter albus]